MIKSCFVLIVVSFLWVPLAFSQGALEKTVSVQKGETSPWFTMTPLVGFNGTSYRGRFKIEDQTNENGTVFEKRIQPQGDVAAGFLIDYNSHKAGFAIQSGFVYSKSKAELDDDINQTVTLFKDEYINIPLMVKIYPFSSAGRWIYFKGGANIGYLLSSAQEKSQEPRTNSVTNTDNEPGEVVTSDTTDLRERVDVQAVFGVGVLFPISKQIGIVVEGNYQHGFVNTSKLSDSVNNELYTQGLSGFLGVNFAL